MLNKEIPNSKTFMKSSVLEPANIYLANRLLELSFSSLPVRQLLHHFFFATTQISMGKSEPKILLASEIWLVLARWIMPAGLKASSNIPYTERTWHKQTLDNQIQSIISHDRFFWYQATTLKSMVNKKQTSD